MGKEIGMRCLELGKERQKCLLASLKTFIREYLNIVRHKSGVVRCLVRIEILMKLCSSVLQGLPKRFWSLWIFDQGYIREVCHLLLASDLQLENVEFIDCNESVKQDILVENKKFAV